MESVVFKPGDRLIRTGPSCNKVVQGNLYIVESCVSNTFGTSVRLRGLNVCYDASLFEIDKAYPEPHPESEDSLQVGDVVECINTEGHDGKYVTLGKYYAVNALHTPNTRMMTATGHECVVLDGIATPLCAYRFSKRTKKENTRPYKEYAIKHTSDLTLTGPSVAKDTNPKDAVGIKKPPSSTVSQLVLKEVGVAMLEGARKYGRHNYREVGVRGSVYYDAARRHIDNWWEGQDIDPDSGLSHITKAIASLVVLRDAMIQGKLQDDRPPTTVDLVEFDKELQRRVDQIFTRYPTAKDAHVKKHST